MGKLDGKVALITGGTQSIGRAMAESFLAEGAKVVVNGRNEEQGLAAVAEMGGGENIAFYPGDACQQEICEGIVDFAIERFGHLDICCLNSGGMKMTAPVAEMTDDEWRLELDWNLNHVFWGMRKALQHMIPRESGRVLVTSSAEGKLGKPGIAGYSAAQHAVNGLVKSAAQEVGTSGITVNAILPGLVPTELVNEAGPSAEAIIDAHAQESALKRSIRAVEVAAVATFLASDAARNITACMFPVDGGATPY